MIRKIRWSELKRPLALGGMVLAFALCLGWSLRVVWSDTTGSMRVIPAGTTVTVRLLQPVDSRSAQAGDRFEARVVAVEPSSSAMVMAPGTRVEGRCVAARAAEYDSRSGYLRLALGGVRDPWGHIVPLEATTVSQWGSEPLPYQESARSNDLSRTAGHSDLAPALLSEAESSEAILTPDTDLTFVLLRPARVSPSPGLP